MNLKAYWFLLVLFSFLPLAQGVDHYKVGDTLYVWAPSGLNIRTQPGISASKLGRLELGTRVIVDAISDQKYDILTISATEKEPSYMLTGTWIKVKSDNLEEFLIDIYLLRFPPPSKEMKIPAFIEELRK